MCPLLCIFFRQITRKAKVLAWASFILLNLLCPLKHHPAPPFFFHPVTSALQAACDGGSTKGLAFYIRSALTVSLLRFRRSRSSSWSNLLRSPVRFWKPMHMQYRNVLHGNGVRCLPRRWNQQVCFMGLCSSLT